MPKRRDYKAEYEATKRRAQTLGYESEREYRKARRGTGVSKRAKPAPKPELEPGALERGAAAIRQERALRRQAKRWADKHSHDPATVYSSRFPTPRVEAYVDTWVNKPKRVGPGREKAHIRRMKNYMVNVSHMMTAEEFDAIYGTPK